MIKRLLFILLVISSAGLASSHEDIGNLTEYAEKLSCHEDIGNLTEYAEKLSSVKNYDGAGVLYNRIALHHSNASDWNNASEYYALAALNFTMAGDYESAGASYRLAGDCCAGQKECDNALEYYELARENYRKNDPDYDGSIRRFESAGKSR
jgi:tetratricopeptide (TPR) repeat protein